MARGKGGRTLVLAVLVVMAAAAVAGLSACGGGEPRASAPQTIVFAGGGIHTINADGTQLSGLTSDKADRSPQWSPDGSRIAFSRESRRPHETSVLVIPREGGAPRRIASGYRPQWSPDGSRLAFVQVPEQQAGSRIKTARIVIADLLGRISKKVVALEGFELADLTARAELSWSPDGERLAFLQHRFKSHAESQLHVATVEQESVVDVIRAVSRYGPLSGLEWSPDGETIAVLAEDSRATVQVLGETYTGSGPCPLPAITCRSAELAFIHADGRAPEELKGGSDLSVTHDLTPAGGSDMAWSADGQWIVFNSIFGAIKVRLDEDPYRRELTDDDAQWLLPDQPSSTTFLSRFEWSPDGQRIGARACPDIREACPLYVIDAQEGGAPLRVARATSFDWLPAKD